MASSSFSRRIETSIAVGNLYEKVIAPQFFTDLGWSYRPSTSEQNWFEHFDYITTKEDKIKRVEVKAPKICKSSDLPSLILLEHTGITGKPGWLQGKADVILQFMSEIDAVCYSREDALRLHPLIDGSIERFHSYNAPIGKWFGRTGANRKGSPNQDIIRWETISSFRDAMPLLRFYQKNENQWKAYYH